MHQGSALFGVVIDVVPSEASSGIPSELLYADDLVLMIVVLLFAMIWSVVKSFKVPD